MLKAIFARESTGGLMKKFLVYKLMGSNLFINHSLTFMNLCYKIFGTRLTNLGVNMSVASMFTSGENIQSLIKDLEAHEKNNIGGIAGYVVEGLERMDEAFVQKVFEHMLEMIQT